LPASQSNRTSSPSPEPEALLIYWGKDRAVSELQQSLDYARRAQTSKELEVPPAEPRAELRMRGLFQDIPGSDTSPIRLKFPR
jgi:hypothetical protein